MLPVPISNPPNPWATTEVEYLEGAPEVKLEVFEDHTRQILAKNDSPDVGFTLQRQPLPRLLPRLRLLLRAAVARVPELGRGHRLRPQDRRQAARAPSCCAPRSTKKSWQRETVVFSGVTDCYQPLEASLPADARRAWRSAPSTRTRSAIITKAPLIERDIDVLPQLRARRRRRTSRSASRSGTRSARGPSSPTSRRRRGGCGSSRRWRGPGCRSA